MSHAAIGQYAIGQFPTLRNNLGAETGSYVLSGQTAGLVVTGPASTGVLAAIGELAIGQLTSVSVGAFTLDASAGAYSLSGQSADLGYHRIFAADAGAYTLTGQSAELGKGFVVTADAGAYVLTGQDADLRSGIDTGAYVLTGQDAGLQHHHVLTSNAGAYVLTGQDATFAVVMPAEAGSYVLTGQDAAVTATRFLYASHLVYENDQYAHVLFAPLGALALGGSSVSLASSRTTFELVGQSLILRRGFSFQADAGSYVVTGQDAAVTATRFLYPETGAYVLTGIAAPSIITMPADAGAYTLTGQSIEFSRRRRRIRGFTRVGGAVTGRPRVGGTITARAA